MEHIHFSENIMILRKKKKVTQEQLADFCGVTKASVSKWETGQSMPDILLLPRIAGYFGVTIDELVGYRAYLTKEQIQKIYEELSVEFAEKNFQDAMKKARMYVKQYYSCYEFLEVIVLLWLNYETLAGEKLPELLQEAKRLCGHILNNSRDICVCNDAIYLKSVIDLQLGDMSAVINSLEDMNNPNRLSMQSEGILLSAYIQAGMMEKADDFAQVMMFLHAVVLVDDATQYLAIHRDNLDKCEETLKRVREIARTYQLEKVNFNCVAVFSYQMAAVYCLYGEIKKAIEQFGKYVELTMDFLQSQGSHIRKDDYFEVLEKWYGQSMLGGNLPRGKKAVYDSVLLSFEAPEFVLLTTEQEFLELKKKVEQMRKEW